MPQPQKRPVEVVTAIALILSLALPSCSRKSSLLLERQAKGPINEEQAIAKQLRWVVSPPTQSNEQAGVEITVTYASLEYLTEFFRNKQVAWHLAKCGKHAWVNDPSRPELVCHHARASVLKGHREPEIT